MLQMYLEAPFATFRTFTAGWYRPTATFLTPSAAYGLLLNVAGIESRLREEDPEHNGSAPASLTKSGLPNVEIALGVPKIKLTERDSDQDPFPRVQTVFQQLHNYPVGTSGKERAESCRGNKYNITPVRREFLSELKAIIAIRGNPDFEDRIQRGLRGEFNSTRYGIPFLGDNSFLIDRLEINERFDSVRWYERIGQGSEVEMKERATRLTICIDRADLSKTTSGLFAPAESCSDVPGDRAWISIETIVPVIEEKSPRKGRRKNE